MSPDLIMESGREDMDLTQRIVLLEANIAEMKTGLRPLERSFRGSDWSDPEVNEAWRAQGRTIHEFNSVTAFADSCVVFFVKYPHKVDAPAMAMLSRAECCVLAWKRGGYDECSRVAREQHRLLRVTR